MIASMLSSAVSPTLDQEAGARLWPEARSEHYQGEYHQLEAEQPGQGRDQMKRINKSKNFPFSITHVLVSMNFCLIQAFWHLKHFHGKNFVELNVKWKYFFQSFITSSLDSQQRVKSCWIKVKSFSLEHSLWCQISPLTMLFRILLIDCPVPREKLWRILKWYFLLFCRRAK